MIVVRARAATASAPVEKVEAPLPCRVGIHLTPTRKRCNGASAGDGDHPVQRMCRVCKRHKTSHVFSGFRGGDDGDMILCGPKKGWSCLDVHLRDAHELDV